MANMDEPGLIELVALGREFRLGTLYDCRTDTIGSTLWDAKILVDKLHTESQKTEDFKFHPSDTIAEKANALNISFATKSSLLSKLIEVKGTAKFFEDRSNSAYIKRATLSYKYTTKCERIMLKDLEVKCDTLGNATHVVTGISYGGKAFFLFEKDISQERELDNSWHNLIESVPFTELDNGGLVDFSEDQKAKAKGLKVKYYGDFSLPQTPTNYEEVVHIYKMLPNLLGEEVPLIVWLSPLSNLGKETTYLTREISTYLVNSIEKLEEDFHQYEIRCNDMKKSAAANNFPGLEKHVSDLQKFASDCRIKVKTELAVAISNVRGGSEEKEIAVILERKDNSPFSLYLVSAWLNNKESEVKFIQQCIDEVKEIHLLSDIADVDAIVADPEVKQVICLKVQHEKKDLLLSAMEEHLNENLDSTQNLQALKTCLKRNDHGRTLMMKCLKLFLKCYEISKSDPSFRYVLVEEILEKGDLKVTVCLYKDGKITVVENCNEDIVCIAKNVSDEVQQAETESTELENKEIANQKHDQSCQSKELPVTSPSLQQESSSNRMYGSPPPYEPPASSDMHRGQQQSQCTTQGANNSVLTSQCFQMGQQPYQGLVNNARQQQTQNLGYAQQPAMGALGFGPYYQQPSPQGGGSNTSDVPQQVPMAPGGYMYGSFPQTPFQQQPNMSPHFSNCPQPWQMQYQYGNPTNQQWGPPPTAWGQQGGRFSTWCPPGYGIPSQPSVPSLMQKEHDSITLKWDKAARRECVTQYEILCEEIGASKKSLKTEDVCESYNIDNLKPGLQYRFKIRAFSEAGASEYSECSENITTLPASPPGKPKAKKLSIHKAHLKWEGSSVIGSNVSPDCCIYVVKIYTEINDEWQEMSTVRMNNTEGEFNIKPNVTYKFKVHLDCGDLGESKSSPESEELNNAVSGLALVKATTKAEAKLIEEGKPSIYQVLAKETHSNPSKKIQNFELGKENLATATTEKVILVVGATGSGKTTLINGMVNYIFGINWTDNCRVKLIVETAEGACANQAVSQTSGISSYTIHHQDNLKIPYTLTIIDTPGFGDTSGILRDKAITEQIREFFTSPDQGGIDHLDAVGFVAQASLPRLTPTQKYIFDSILSLFGKDIAGNIFMLLTFADGQKPPVLDGLKEAKLPYKKCFKFNNSALFANTTNNYMSNVCDEDDDDDDDEDDDCFDDDEDNFDEMFWKMGEKSFKQFLDNLNKVEPKTLALTRDVLEERNRLEVSVLGIQHDIQRGLNKLEQLQHEVKVLKAHEADIDKNKDFTYTVNEETVELTNIDPGTYTTNCLTCKRTCHYPCGIRDNEDKAGCWAMTNGTCRICPKNCVWNIHKNLPHKYEIKRVQVTKTAADLKKRYEEAQGNQLTAQQLIEKVLEEFEEIQIKVIGLTETVRTSLKKLKEIALKPSPLSTTEYIDILIESERAETKPGWQERVDQLQQVRKQAEYMMQLADQGYDPFAKYRKNIREAKKKKSFWAKVLNPSSWYKK